MPYLLYYKIYYITLPDESKSHQTQTCPVGFAMFLIGPEQKVIGSKTYIRFNAIELFLEAAFFVAEIVVFKLKTTNLPLRMTALELKRHTNATLCDLCSEKFQTQNAFIMIILGKPIWEVFISRKIYK